MYKFEWDPTKDKANQKKHGISFEEAKSVFLMKMPLNFMILIIHMKKNSFSCLG